MINLSLIEGNDEEEYFRIPSDSALREITAMTTGTKKKLGYKKDGKKNTTFWFELFWIEAVDRDLKIMHGGDGAGRYDIRVLLYTGHPENNRVVKRMIRNGPITLQTGPL